MLCFKHDTEIQVNKSIWGDMTSQTFTYKCTAMPPEYKRRGVDGNHVLTDAQKGQEEAGCLKKEKKTSESAKRKAVCPAGKGLADRFAVVLQNSLKRSHTLTNDCKNDGWTISSQSSSDKEEKV